MTIVTVKTFFTNAVHNNFFGIESFGCGMALQHKIII